jgi:hypothetical protein
MVLSSSISGGHGPAGLFAGGEVTVGGARTPGPALYCYLGVGDDKIFDVGFLSDLDAYDTLLNRMEERAGESVLTALAREYLAAVGPPGRRLRPLPDGG